MAAGPRTRRTTKKSGCSRATEEVLLEEEARSRARVLERVLSDQELVEGVSRGCRRPLQPSEAERVERFRDESWGAEEEGQKSCASCLKRGCCLRRESGRDREGTVSGNGQILGESPVENHCLDRRDLQAGEGQRNVCQEAAMQTCPQNHLPQVAILGHHPEIAPPRVGRVQTFPLM